MRQLLWNDGDGNNVYNDMIQLQLQSLQTQSKKEDDMTIK
jgi:hypothetical protein